MHTGGSGRTATASRSCIEFSESTAPFLPNAPWAWSSRASGESEDAGQVLLADVVRWKWAELSFAWSSRLELFHSEPISTGSSPAPSMLRFGCSSWRMSFRGPGLSARSCPPLTLATPSAPISDRSSCSSQELCALWHLLSSCAPSEARMLACPVNSVSRIGLASPVDSGQPEWLYAIEGSLLTTDEGNLRTSELSRLIVSEGSLFAPWIAHSKTAESHDRALAASFVGGPNASLCWQQGARLKPDSTSSPSQLTFC